MRSQGTPNQAREQKGNVPAIYDRLHKCTKTEDRLD